MALKKICYGFLLFTIILSTAQAESLIPLLSSPHALLKQMHVLRPVENSKMLQLTIWLNPRNKEKLDQRVKEIYDPNSIHYQKFLKSGEYESLYAPTKEMAQSIINYFSMFGIKAKVINHRIEMTASARLIEQAFKVELNYYRHQQKIFYSNAQAPQLPISIAKLTAQINGLSNIPKYHPHIRKLTPSESTKNFKPHRLHFVWDSFRPFAQPTTTSFIGFTGSTLRTAYSVGNVAPINGTSINGSGQTLIIIDACGTRTPSQIMSDANLYNAANNLTVFTANNFAVLNPDGTPFTSCSSPDADWNSEIALDIQASHTMAPAANTVLVLAQSDAAPLDTAIDDVTNALINNNFTFGGFPNAYVVSNSWGGSETTGIEPGVENTLERAAAHGISFNFSTGDCGDQTYNSSWPCSAQGVTPTVEFPASSAYVTAVGGTSLFVDTNWNYAFEALWGSHLDSGFYAGTTGGISQFYGPVSWQSAISGFTAGGYAGTVGQYNKRALPDISMLADPYTGLTIFENSVSFVYGGTSLACPLFSGTLILLNQVRTLLNGGTPRPIGQAAPYFYINNSTLLRAQALHLVTPPHQIIAGARLPPAGAPISAFKIHNHLYHYDLTFGWDSSLTIQPENQFWNDGVGVGSLNIPNFLNTMGSL